MALTASQLAALRAELGTAAPPTDNDLETLFLTFGTTQAVALAVLRDRINGPDSVQIAGEYSEHFNKTALEKQLERIAAGPHDLSGAAIVSTVTLTRPARRRRPGPFIIP